MFKKIKRTFQQHQFTPKQFENIFYALMLGGMLIFLASLVILGPSGFFNLFYAQGDDLFMDFFNPLIWSHHLSTVYSNAWVIYPPAVLTFFSALATTIPAPLLEWGAPILKSPRGILVFSLYSLLTIGTFWFMLFKFKQGNIKSKLLFLFFTTFSFPFLFWFQRANFILVTCILMLFFVFFYDAKKGWVRQVALLALACAITTKIYPAALGMLLLQQKRWKDIFDLGVYSIALLAIPFLWCGGMPAIEQYIANTTGLASGANDFSWAHIFNYTLQNTLRVYTALFTFGKQYAALNSVFTWLVYLAFVWGATASYFLKTKWKTVALLTLLIILIPAISYTYALILLIIPLLLFLNDTQMKNKKDLTYLVLFVLSLALNFSTYTPFNINNMLARTAIVIMFALLSCEGTKEMLKSIAAKFPRRDHQRQTKP